MSDLSEVKNAPSASVALRGSGVKRTEWMDVQASTLRKTALSAGDPAAYDAARAAIDNHPVTFGCISEWHSRWQMGSPKHSKFQRPCRTGSAES